jgi:hypothetical protein
MMPMPAYRPMVASRKMKPIHSRDRAQLLEDGQDDHEEKKPPVYQV